jgi:hypothetical protein
VPSPSAHIFYHRRIDEANDALPKFNGYWLSTIAVIRLIARGLFAKGSVT